MLPVCLTVTLIGTKSASDTHGFSGTSAAAFTLTGVPGTTYTATGKHSGIIEYLDNEYSDTLNPTQFYDAYNFGYFESPLETYPDIYDWFGPGPPEGRSTSSVQAGDTTAIATDPQIPGALSVLSSPAITYKTPYANGCPLTAPYGASLAITYQVLDASPQHAAIANSKMEPQEQTSNSVINGKASGSGPAPNWQDIGPSTYFVDGSPIPGTSKFTNAQGQFLDAAFQECADAPVTVTVTQSIRVLVNGSTYSVRANNWSVSSTSIGHGTINNGGDINHTF